MSAIETIKAAYAAFGRNDPYAVSPLTRTGRKSTCSSVRFAATRPGYERFTEQVFRKAPLVFYGWDAWPAPPARAAGAMEWPRPATGLPGRDRPRTIWFVLRGLKRSRRYRRGQRSGSRAG